MVRLTDAIFENGVLKPLKPLGLREHQRVTLTIADSDEMIDSSMLNPDREAAIAALKESVRTSSFRSTGSYPKREELYDRPL